MSGFRFCCTLCWLAVFPDCDIENFNVIRGFFVVFENDLEFSCDLRSVLFAEAVFVFCTSDTYLLAVPGFDFLCLPSILESSKGDFFIRFFFFLLATPATTPAGGLQRGGS